MHAACRTTVIRCNGDAGGLPSIKLFHIDHRFGTKIETCLDTMESANRASVLPSSIAAILDPEQL